MLDSKPNETQQQPQAYTPPPIEYQNAQGQRVPPPIVVDIDEDEIPF
jgi:hypothetical protein